MTEKDGVLDLEYHYDRQKRQSHIYRCKRRGIEVVRVIQTYFPRTLRVLDIGTADGLMIPVLLEHFPSLQVIGIDRSFALLNVANRTEISPVLADAVVPPFAAATFDVISATAVIEHLHAPETMLRHCWQVLRPGGGCIITTPDPFFEHIATRLGLLPDEQHYSVLNLRRVRQMMENVGFRVLETRKFMMSPVGFPMEIKIEQMLRKFSLDFLFMNQIVVGQRL